MSIGRGVSIGCKRPARAMELVVIAIVFSFLAQLRVVSARAQAFSTPGSPSSFASVRFFDLNRSRNEQTDGQKHSTSFVAAETKTEKHNELFRSKPFVALAIGTYAFGTLDMRQSMIDGATASSERDPLAKPLLALPHPLYFVTGYALLTGVNWIAWKMDRSPRWHRIWWLPQLATMSGNVYGYATSRTW